MGSAGFLGCQYLENSRVSSRRTAGHGESGARWGRGQWQVWGSHPGRVRTSQSARGLFGRTDLASVLQTVIGRQRGGCALRPPVGGRSFLSRGEQWPLHPRGRALARARADRFLAAGTGLRCPRAGWAIRRPGFRAPQTAWAVALQPSDPRGFTQASRAKSAVSNPTGLQGLPGPFSRGPDGAGICEALGHAVTSEMPPRGCWQEEGPTSRFLRPYLPPAVGLGTNLPTGRWAGPAPGGPWWMGKGRGLCSPSSSFVQ